MLKILLRRDRLECVFAAAKDLAIVGRVLFNVCFAFGALKIRDRIQTIPFKMIAKASRGPQYRGTFIQDV